MGAQSWVDAMEVDAVGYNPTTCEAAAQQLFVAVAQVLEGNGTGCAYNWASEIGVRRCEGCQEGHSPYHDPLQQ